MSELTTEAQISRLSILRDEVSSLIETLRELRAVEDELRWTQNRFGELKQLVLVLRAERMKAIKPPVGPAFFKAVDDVCRFTEGD